jgi:hypothetical protein
MLGMLAESKEQQLRQRSYSENCRVVSRDTRPPYAWHPPPRQRLTHAPEGYVGRLCFFCANTNPKRERGNRYTILPSLTLRVGVLPTGLQVARTVTFQW